MMRGVSATALVFWPRAPSRLRDLALPLLALHMSQATRLSELIYPAVSFCTLAWWLVAHAAVVVVVLAVRKEAWAVVPGPCEAPRLAAPRPPYVVSAPSYGSSCGHVRVWRVDQCRRMLVNVHGVLVIMPNTRGRFGF